MLTILTLLDVKTTVSKARLLERIFYVFRSP